MITIKEKLQNEAESLLKQAQHASESAQRAEGQAYRESKNQADALWSKYYEAVRKAHECTG